MARPHGAVLTLRVGDRVVHGTTLAGAAGRGGLGWIFGATVGYCGLMASQHIDFSCDRASSL